MADGTFATYQGHALARCTFVRSRGWGASTSTVEILSGARGPVEVQPAIPARIFASVTRGPGNSPPPPPPSPPPSPPGGSLPETQVRPGDGPPRLEPVGTLLMYEVVGSAVYAVTVPGLYVIRSESVRRSDADPIERVRLTLVDVRYFFALGLLPRWSFNRLRADGSVALNSVRPDRERFSKREIANLVCSSLPSQPRLAVAPAKWSDDRGAIEFERFGHSIVALRQLAATSGLEEPCLRLDGSIALHAAGDGAVRYAPGGAGANTDEIPATDAAGGGVLLYKEGAGHGSVVEPQFPEEFVLVVGGERIATVAVDDWEPVLVTSDETVLPLTEATVRALTGGRWGLDWLKVFVLRPRADQQINGLDPEVAELLARQAWRMFRLPGVEKVSSDGVAGRGPVALSPGAAESAQAGSALDALRRVVHEVTEPGPNAHLLPLLDRAETVAGRRRPVRVEAFRFTPETQIARSGPASEELQEVQQQIRRIRGVAPPRSAVVKYAPLGLDQLFKFDRNRAGRRGVSFEELSRALVVARDTEAYRDQGVAGKNYADAITPLLAAQAELSEKTGGAAGQSEILSAAFKIAALERQLYEDASLAESAELGLQGALGADSLDEVLDRRRGARDTLLLELDTLFERVERERFEREERKKAGLSASVDKPLGLVLLVNRKRSEDTGARVYSESLGIVQTSALAGHVDPDRAPDASGATFRPLAVRVTFGAVVRPRLDVPAGQLATGTTFTEQGGTFNGLTELDTRIPAALSDDRTYYTAAFQRVGRNQVRKVDIDTVDRSRAVRVEADLVELVPLDEPSNVEELDRQALAIALERSNVPDSVTTERRCLARPWPIQCDGVVESVTITMREKNGAPCGFETLVVTGATAAPGAPALGRSAVRGQASKREGLT